MTIWESSKELSEKKGPPSEILLLARPCPLPATGGLEILPHSALGES
jgi:hypothetical protein